MSEQLRAIIGDNSIRVESQSTSFTIPKTANQTAVSPFGILNDDRIEKDAVYDFSSISRDNTWIVLRAIWAATNREYLAIEKPSDEKYAYIVQSGLGFDSPSDSAVVILSRESFWQGAGASVENHWLKATTAVDFSPVSAFPQIQSFTKNELVATVHPLRPPKPAPGTVFYERYINVVGQSLSFVHIDGTNTEHFEFYKKWQNSDRVNVGWREKGPDEKHHQYIKDRLEDKHMMGFIFCWNGKPAGYGELAWVKEDPINVYCGGMEDYDQGIHLLVGEEEFRGKDRFVATVTSMMHCCFLRDARTQNVVIEPRVDLGLGPRLKALLPVELNREFEFPHKRAFYYKQRRQRFFQAASFA
ncbi:hypothetical protein E3Q22_02007 [Wallemia mellicola]|uniref:Acyltransferase MbtK/IucB-like conserved domain-containing protein n=1 Tax=Wallemia mellicola TaxID=1708541 RepID=A0A4T0QXU1_9BASI|nr:hypothetical protein E3Q24_04234 [Wallemia mellicola]TIB74630.1 hypothetical protein E3Q23_02620 [Wallemia mellicola]TIB79104.1 hypothetical protein E3Q21_04256 [Wallemia mellicola]TIB80305.1 hypothetical protein E3Q22_02007 [Wallemia mellicola]TIB83218.1 hypothetical protein E3Q20_04246 [Wallemia mellicola]